MGTTHKGSGGGRDRSQALAYRRLKKAVLNNTRTGNIFLYAELCPQGVKARGMTYDDLSNIVQYQYIISWSVLEMAVASIDPLQDAYDRVVQKLRPTEELALEANL